jgi:site-specific DNA recombinase
VIERLREAVATGSLASEVEASVKERLRGRRKDLLMERKKLPEQIAALSAEGKRLLDTMADVNGIARRLAEKRLQGLGDELGRCETRLATVERELASIEKAELESSWVATCLNDFTAIWDVLTPENRGRLLRSVVQRVEVDEPANQVKVFMVDLCAGLPALVEAEAAEVSA